MSQINHFSAITVLICFNLCIIEASIGQTKLCTPFDTLCAKNPDFSKVSNVPKPDVIQKYHNDEERPNMKQYHDNVVEENEKFNQTESPKIECKIGKCYKISECFLEFGEKEFVLCSLPNEAKGVCCSIDENLFYGYRQSLFELKPISYPALTPGLGSQSSRTLVNNALNTAMKSVVEIDKLEEELYRKKLFPQRGSQAYFHQSFSGRNPEAVKLARIGLIGLKTTIGLSKNLRWSSSHNKTDFHKIDISGTSVSNECPKEPTCTRSKYRTADGSCNNLNNKSWGKAMSGFDRMLSPDYADGIDKPRIARDGSQLLSAREVSVRIGPERNYPNFRYNFLAMQFGQFIDHDLTRTAGTRTNDNNEILCCGEVFDRNPELLHEACLPIMIPPNVDSSRNSKKCMEFVRSAVAPSHGCELGAREQLNQLSAYIDGGMIYGSSEEQSESLRSFRGGRLKISIVESQEFLPQMNNSGGCSISQDLNEKCFTAGDGRVNLLTPLVLVHAIFLREHNRIADILRELNPKWNDEVIYQETRRIVIAELQHITYMEFLPIILDRKTMKQNRICVMRKGYSDRYSPGTDATISNVFATASFRFHSAVPGFVYLKNSHNKVLDRIRVRDQFFDPSIFYSPGIFERLIYGLTGQSIQEVDHFFTRDLTNHLFQEKGHSSGLDLIALNIQRGRDHGLPGYNEWRELCGLQRIESFQELESVFDDPSVARELSLLYRTVDDCDLFIAAVSERHLPEAMVGPTFACIIGEQFRRIKEGDRFWFENGGLESSFSPKQLEEIRKTSLARILCDNSEIKRIQPLAMVRTCQWNPKFLCNSNQIPRMDLSVWRDNKTEDNFEKPVEE